MPHVYQNVGRPQSCEELCPKCERTAAGVGGFLGEEKRKSVQKDAPPLRSCQSGMLTGAYLPLFSLEGGGHSAGGGGQGGGGREGVQRKGARGRVGSWLADVPEQGTLGSES